MNLLKEPHTWEKLYANHKEYTQENYINHKKIELQKTNIIFHQQVLKGSKINFPKKNDVVHRWTNFPFESGSGNRYFGFGGLLQVCWQVYGGFLGVSSGQGLVVTWDTPAETWSMPANIWKYVRNVMGEAFRYPGWQAPPGFCRPTLRIIKTRELFSKVDLFLIYI